MVGLMIEIPKLIIVSIIWEILKAGNIFVIYWTHAKVKRIDV